jgi:4'-phosphopantetheinyl transferase
MSKLQLLWDPPPEQWQLDAGDVHVWAAQLDQPPERLSSFEQTLSPDELERAARFHFEIHRSRFIAGRGTLRAILGTYLQIEPAQLRFVYSERGKPALTGLPGNHALHFNLAHSEGLILIAVTRACPLGVDVERIGPATDATDIACEFFSPREAAGLRALAGDKRRLAFFNLWTRKEACLKASGAGISEMLAQMEVSFLPGEPPRVLAISGNSQAGAAWILAALSPAAEFTGAVAAEAEGLRFSYWQRSC